MIRFYTVSNNSRATSKNKDLFAWNMGTKVQERLAHEALMNCFALVDEDGQVGNLRAIIDGAELDWFRQHMTASISVGDHESIEYDNEIAYHVLPIILFLLKRNGFVISADN